MYNEVCILDKKQFEIVRLSETDYSVGETAKETGITKSSEEWTLKNFCSVGSFTPIKGLGSSRKTTIIAENRSMQTISKRNGRRALSEAAAITKLKENK